MLLSAQALQRGLYVEDGIIADLGDGSLELAVLKRGKTREMISLPLGTMRLQARLSGDMEKIRAAVSAELDAVKWLGDHAGKQLFPSAARGAPSPASRSRTTTIRSTLFTVIRCRLSVSVKVMSTTRCHPAGWRRIRL